MLFIITKKIIEPQEIVSAKVITDDSIQVNVHYDTYVEAVDLDEYLVGVVCSEMPITFEDEALKAQIVASRTYVLSRGLNVDSTTNSQVYTDKETLMNRWGKDYESNYQRLMNLVIATNHEVMTYEGNYISALFFSCSNGMTENCEDYFSGGKPYLLSVDSSWDEDTCENMHRTATFTKEQISALFGFEVDSIEILSYKDSGRVDQVQVNDTIYTGREFREILDLASSDFSISLEGDTYTINTIGSGHGVGMSQYGANAMALLGYSYHDILHYYYTNINIESL